MEEFFGVPGQWLIVIGVNFFLILILLLMNLSNRAKIKRLRNKYNKFMSGSSGRNIEDLLDECLDKVKDMNDKNRDIEGRINTIERNLLSCMQKVGVVRFNAFDNVGSDLSFSIAILDNNDNGVVISGLYARESSFTYAKPIVSGNSKYALSAEELKAIDIAKKSHRHSLSGSYSSAAYDD